MTNLEGVQSICYELEETINEVKGDEVEGKSGTRGTGTPKDGYERRGRTTGSGVRQRRKALPPNANETCTVMDMKSFQESVQTSSEQFMNIIRQKRQAEHPERTSRYGICTSRR